MRLSSGFLLAVAAFGVSLSAGRPADAQTAQITKWRGVAKASNIKVD